MKRVIKAILNNIPRPVLIKLSYLFMKVSPLIYKGNQVECPICESTFKKFLPYGYSEVRHNALCPKCLSLERHRLMWLFLKKETNFFNQDLKVLHIAPEQCFYKRFKKLPNIRYTTADLESPIADYHCDVQELPFEDNSYDVVICNHVLEHVDDDLKAMKEVKRVMNQNGFAILMVPFETSLDSTYEDPAITDPKERTKHFKQYDHKRLYGLDFPLRLKEAGFSFTTPSFEEKIDESLKIRMGLPQKEFLFALKK